MTILDLIGNIWFRRAVLALVVSAALLFARQHYINVGKAQGTADAGQRAAEGNFASLKSDRDTTAPQLAELTKQMAALAQQTANLQQLVTAVVLQRQQLPQQVNGMTRAQVEQVLAEHLGKAPGEPETPQDRKEFAKCFLDLDLCNQQAKGQADIIAQQLASLGTSQRRYDLLAGYTTRVESKYVELWNQKAEPKRSWKCLRLWRCSRPQISAPNPHDLLQRPAEPVN